MSHQYQMDIRPWFREDLVHLIQSADYLCSQWSMSEERRSGFLDALTMLALAIGADLPDIWQRTDTIIEGQK